MSGLLQFMQHFMEHTMGQESASMELEEVLKNLAVVMFKNLSPKWVEHVLSCLELAHSKAAANSSSASQWRPTSVLRAARRVNE